MPTRLTMTPTSTNAKLATTKFDLQTLEETPSNATQ